MFFYIFKDFQAPRGPSSLSKKTSNSFFNSIPVPKLWFYCRTRHSDLAHSSDLCSTSYSSVSSDSEALLGTYLIFLPYTHGTGQGWKKPGFFFKKPSPVGFFGFFWVFWVFLGFFGSFSQTRGFLGFFSVSRLLLGASRL